jgi:ABC-type transport system involved in cytochrome bd biosynthesis fused ATPase/permease subunit
MTMLANHHSDHESDQNVTQPDRPYDSTVLTTTTPDDITVVDVTKEFGRGSDAVVALDHISLTVGRGEFVSVLGASGC